MPKKVTKTRKLDRKGVAAVGLMVAQDLDWIFREQPTDDYGIDAQLEVVDDEIATGRLLAAQIKAGSSYFEKPADDGSGWWYSLKRDDLEYWTDHSLPVVVVLYDPVAKVAYWQVVNERTVATGKKGGKKLLIPRSQRLDAASRQPLSEAAEGKPYDLHVRKLRLSLPWMRMLQDGRRILLEADEWVNKSSGRGDVQIVSVDDANEDRMELGSWFIMAGFSSYEEVLLSLFPWADAILHQETYDAADYEAWEVECVHHDKEGDRFVSESFEEWMVTREGDGALRPYANTSGEVDSWRLELVLNDLGRGFLAVDEFAQGNGLMLTPPRQ